MTKKIFLKKGKEESLQRRHPWVFSGAIDYADSQVEEGEVVDVMASDGSFLGRGQAQIGSIAVRILTFDASEPVDNKLWKNRLKAALRVRKSLNLIRPNAEGPLPANTTYRLVHGEGDGLPGLVVDIYGTTAVMQAHTVGMHLVRHDIAEALKAVMGSDITNIYYKSETTLPYKAQLDEESGFIIGDGKAGDVTVENGLQFHVDWIRGQKTGFFIDQRDNRSLLEHYAHGRSVLNMFCYTGGFSVYAMRGGATSVHSVDSSAKAIELTELNVAQNFPADGRHKAICDDAFKYLDQHHDSYDLIILDPPAFAKHRKAVHNALKGYIRLNTKGLEHIKRGGILFTFSCSQAINKDQFRQAVFTASLLAKRNVRILHQLHQPADHPINIYHPEGEYLKGLVLYVE